MTRGLLNSRTRVLSGALALHRFTVAELAAYSGVNPRSVKSVLDRDKDYFNVVGKVATGKKGGQPDQYSLKPRHRQLLQAALVSLRGETSEGASELTGEVTSAPSFEDQSPAQRAGQELRFLSAANAARESMRQVRDSVDPARRTAQIAQVRTHMAALPGLLRLAAQSSSYQDFERSWTELKHQWQETLREGPRREAEKPQSDAPSSAASQAVPGLRRQAADILQWLINWVRHSPCITPIGASGGEVAVERLVARHSHLPMPLSLLEPAATLAANKAQCSSSEWEGLRGEVAQSLSDPLVLDVPSRFAALVACAAVTESQAALKPILETIARSDFDERLAGEERRIALLSIARLGHPALDGAHQAALVSYLLLSRTRCYERDAVELLPAALRSEDVDELGLLERFARSAYGTEPGLAEETERSLMLNLATVFSAGCLDRLARVIPELLSTSHGIRFLSALIDKRHQAVRLRGDDPQNFLVSPGLLLMQAGGMKVTEVPVNVEPRSEQGRTLNRLISSNSDTFRTSRSASVVPIELGSGEVDSGMLFFLAALKQSRQAALLRGR